MANSNEEEEKKQLKKNPTVKTNEQSKEQKNSSHNKNNVYISGLAIFLAICAVVVAFWTIQLQKKLVNDNTNLTTQLEKLKKTQINSQKQIDAKDNNIQQTQSGLQNKLNQLNKQLQTAINQRPYQNQDWILIKARYYLELAQVNAHWSNDFNAAIALLGQADRLLEQLHEPKVFAIRQAIAKEIILLKAIPTIDIAGLLSKLDAAQISISNLTLQSAIDDNKSVTETVSSETANPSVWQTRLLKSVSLLKKLVVIRRDDEKIKPLISPLFEAILKESIRLNLQEAQWAILNNNPIVYQLALKQASMNLKRTFTETSRNTVELLKQFNELQQVKIIQEKPKIELALPLLNQMINNVTLDVSPPVHSGGKGEN